MSLPSKVDTAKSGELGEYEYRSVEAIVMGWQLASGHEMLEYRDNLFRTNSVFLMVIAATAGTFVRGIFTRQSYVHPAHVNSSHGLPAALRAQLFFS